MYNYSYPYKTRIEALEHYYEYINKECDCDDHMTIDAEEIIFTYPSLPNTVAFDNEGKPFRVVSFAMCDDGNPLPYSCPISDNKGTMTIMCEEYIAGREYNLGFRMIFIGMIHEADLKDLHELYNSVNEKVSYRQYKRCVKRLGLKVLRNNQKLEL